MKIKNNTTNNPAQYSEFIDDLGTLSFINYTSLVNLNRIKPTGTLGNFIAYTDIKNVAAKIRPQQGTQIRDLVEEIARNGDQGGALTEEIATLIFGEHFDMISGKFKGNNGLDELGKSLTDSKIMSFEAKQFSNPPSVGQGWGYYLNPENTATGLPTQMSNDWHRYCNRELARTGQTQAANLLNNPSAIEKYGVVVERNRKEVWIFKLDIF